MAIKYYFFGGQRVAMKSGSTLTYLHGDHLGSTALATTSGGAWQSQEKYFAYGKDRDSANNVPTDHRYTGQKSDGSGLMYYSSRYYDPQTGLFVSPDTIVPDAGNVFAYNRSMYVLGRVMNANDPSGHAANDKAITAGDGAGTYSTVFFEYDSFVCSQDTCFGATGALDQDSAGLLLLKELTSHNKDVAMAMSMIGGGESVLPEGATTSTLVNSKGVPYPEVTDIKTGELISYPGDGLQKIPKTERVEYGPKERGEFIKEWYARGYEDPPGGWKEYDIHHIQPREYGGTNDFENLTPVNRTTHQQVINPWWQAYE